MIPPEGPRGSDGLPSQIDVSVVVPFYNPGHQLRPTVEALLHEMAGTGLSFEVIAVSDGSDDGSAASLQDLLGPHLDLYEFPQNRGKGHVLRFGFQQGRGRYVGFIDADGDIPPALMAEFALIAEKESPDGVLGSKNHPDSQIDAPSRRRLMSGLWQTLVQALFHLPVEDTQTGIKLFSRELIDDVLSDTVMDGFSFDLELLIIASDRGYTDFVEPPVAIAKRSTSTVSARRATAMVVDLGTLFWRNRLRSGRRLRTVR